MSAVKHTSGPWKVYERRLPYITPNGNSGEHIEYAIGTEWVHPQLKGPMPVVGVSVGLGDGGVTKAHYFVCTSKSDAHLIAAAPELLEALRAARCCMQDDSAAARTIDAAIAKATGSTEPANPYQVGSVREGWQRGYEGRPMLAAAGSDYARAYAEGQRAKATGGQA